MLTIGDKFPEFNLPAVKGGINGDHTDSFTQISNSTYSGKWMVVFFWPKDFTFVCPTEIAEFGIKNANFAAQNTQVLGVSTDSDFVHLAWKKSHKDLTDLPFPMLSDIKHELCNDLGILHAAGVANRATFIVDNKGIIRFVSVTDLSVGRNVDEVLRVLDALQTGKLTPCNWKPGSATL